MKWMCITNNQKWKSNHKSDVGDQILYHMMTEFALVKYISVKPYNKLSVLINLICSDCTNEILDLGFCMDLDLLVLRNISPIFH